MHCSCPMNSVRGAKKLKIKKKKNANANSGRGKRKMFCASQTLTIYSFALTKRSLYIVEIT